MQRHLAIVAAAGIGLLTAGQAAGLPPIWEAWEEKYLSENPALKEQVLLRAQVQVSGGTCMVCHHMHDKKRYHPYRAAIAKLLHRDDWWDKAKIRQALDAVDQMQIDPKDENSPTFGDRIRSGRLP